MFQTWGRKRIPIFLTIVYLVATKTDHTSQSLREGLEKNKKRTHMEREVPSVFFAEREALDEYSPATMVPPGILIIAGFIGSLSGPIWSVEIAFSPQGGPPVITGL